MRLSNEYLLIIRFIDIEHKSSYAASKSEVIH